MTVTLSVHWIIWGVAGFLMLFNFMFWRMHAAFVDCGFEVLLWTICALLIIILALVAELIW